METQHRSPVKSPWVVVFLLIATGLVVFWPVQFHDFLLWDDHAYIADNPRVRTGLSVENVLWAFTTSHASYWHPLTWISHMLDCELFGLNPQGHHFSSLPFHLANTVLLFFILRKMTGAYWKSAFVAALFCLHPLRVESVAWVSERKDLLGGFFWMTTLAAYLRYVNRPTVARYLLTFLSFALGLMAKPSLVTLPLALILLDYWPLGRSPWLRSPAGVQTAPFSRLVLEKIPFLLPTALSSLITFYGSVGHGVIPSLEAVSLKLRLANALVSYVKYLLLTIWPADLAFFYPHPMAGLPLWQVAGSFLLLGAITSLVFLHAKRLPYLLVGWLWYLGNLFPVIGVVQIAAQAMADRFTYIPHIGLFVAAVWGCEELFAARPYTKALLPLISGLALCLLGVSTHFQLRHWSDNVSLFSQALKVTKDNYVVHNCLGLALSQEGRAEEAVPHFLESHRINPGYLPPLRSLGSIMAQQGRLEEALLFSEKALDLSPGDASVHANVGNILARQGKREAAVLHFRKALEAQPDFAPARHGLANLLKQEGRTSPASTSGLPPG